MTPATKTPTLGRAEYEARRDMLSRECNQAARAYQEAALLNATSDGGEGREVLAELRADLDASYQAIDDLEAAWKAAQEYAVVERSDEDEQRRREAYEAARQHLANAARLVAEIEALALRMGDLVEQAVAADQEARRVVSALVKPEAMAAVPYRLTFDNHEMDLLLEAAGDRYYGKRHPAVDAAVHSAARATKHRERFARLLGQEFINDNDEEAGS